MIYKHIDKTVAYRTKPGKSTWYGKNWKLYQGVNKLKI